MIAKLLGLLLAVGLVAGALWGASRRGDVAEGSAAEVPAAPGAAAAVELAEPSLPALEPPAPAAADAPVLPDDTELSYENPIVTENPDGSFTIRKLAKVRHADGSEVLMPVTIEATPREVPMPILRSDPVSPEEPQ